jgi:hypothetical protein
MGKAKALPAPTSGILQNITRIAIRAAFPQTLSARAQR